MADVVSFAALTAAAAEAREKAHAAHDATWSLERRFVCRCGLAFDVDRQHFAHVVEMGGAAVVAAVLRALADHFRALTHTHRKGGHLVDAGYENAADWLAALIPEDQR